nr:hypothetical protein [Brevundimonas nasdae]
MTTVPLRGHLETVGRLGLVLDDVDGARQRASAEQGRLRPANHFDPLQVEKFDKGAARLGHGRPILKHRDTRLLVRRSVAAGDAPQCKGGVGRRFRLHAQPGNERGQIDEILDPTLRKRGFAHDADRNGHLDLRLGTTLRRHHDIVDLLLDVRARGTGLGACGARLPERERASDADREKGRLPGEHENSQNGDFGPRLALITPNAVGYGARTDRLKDT